MQTDPRKLLEKYKAGQCSDKEKALVESWYLELQSGDEAPSHSVIENTKDKMWKELNVHTGRNLNIKRLHTSAKIAAAVAFVLISAALYFRSYFPVQRGSKTAVTKNEGINPGGNKAYLTLADGKKISLTDAENGTIQQQKGLKISKTDDGTLVYEVAKTEHQEKNVKTLYNTIETPRGGQYQINLPDGTKVWLNAASLLKYPTQFSGSKRIVELEGEGYFEVAKNKNQKFIVKTASQEVEVLGTHFNINGYKDEATIKTTLLEGAVRISLARGKKVEASTLLKPGQQSELFGKTIDVKSVDTENVLAWKNGDFIFKGDDFNSIMRKIARWYDVEVVYKGDFEDLKFGGYISRSKNISSVLSIMESTGKVHFKIEGKTITVTKINKNH